MHIHEYQAKALLSKAGLNVSDGVVVTSAEDAYSQAQRMNVPLIVVKAQIHAGGRGKGGGVILCKSPYEVKTACEKLLNKPLITPQTDANGQMVHTVYLEAGVEIDREFYISFVLDRQKGCMCLIASAQGGSDIEAIAQNTPDQICKISLYSAMGLMPFHVRQVAQVLGLPQGHHHAELNKILKILYDLVLRYDAELIEINPLVLTDQGMLHVLDAKMSVDDNALFRQADILVLKDSTQQSPIETMAQEHDLSYIKLNGSIGCMVNGAGLAMATMDLIKARGGEPANFLDVGGSASAEKVEIAFKMIVSDPEVKGIFVNIFGGIMKCDIIAQGIVSAVQNLDLKVPLVVRLQGTNAQEGHNILQTSTVPIVAIDDLDEAAQSIVQHVSCK